MKTSLHLNNKKIEDFSHFYLSGNRQTLTLFCNNGTNILIINVSNLEILSGKGCTSITGCGFQWKIEEKEWNFCNFQIFT